MLTKDQESLRTLSRGSQVRSTKKAAVGRAFMLRIGEPPARVPHGKIIHRIIFPPLLRFLKHKYFALCEARQGALLLDYASFEKLDQTFLLLRNAFTLLNNNLPHQASRIKTEKRLIFTE